MSYQFSTTTSLSDETYLESFVESISASLPNEMRRNLEHLRDLDRTSSRLIEDWRERQDACLGGVEGALLEAFRAEATAAAAAATAKERRRDSAKRKQQQRHPATPLSEEEEKKPACAKCRARKVSCDGTQPYCLIQLDTSSDSENGCGDGGSVDEVDDGPKRRRLDEDEEIHRKSSDVKQENATTSPPTTMLSREEISAYLQGLGPPTNAEVQTMLRAHNPRYASQRQEIDGLHRDLRQFSSERIDTAEQLKSMVDMALGRLNRDLEKFERELGINHPPPDDAAADNRASRANAAGWAGGGISGGGGSGSMVGRGHHAHSAAGGAAGAVRGAARNVPSGTSTSRSTTAIPPASAAANNAARLKRSFSSTAAASSSAAIPPSAPSAMQQPYSSLRGIVPPPPKSVQTTNLAAVQVTPNSPDWILAKILSHDKATKTYTLSDEDVQSNQIYKVPERRAVVLRGTERNRWARGDAVYAVYPDTTSFYRATVSTPQFNGFVMVQFKDDRDANGVTHEKAVLMAHVMKVPLGGK